MLLAASVTAAAAAAMCTTCKMYEDRHTCLHANTYTVSMAILQVNLVIPDLGVFRLDKEGFTF